MARRRRASPKRPRSAVPASERVRVPVWVLAALLVAAGSWAYATSFGGVLVLDDVRAIARNPTIRTLWPLSTPLSPPERATVSGRPVANLSFALNYALAPPEARDVFVPAGPSLPPEAAELSRRNLRGYHLLNLVTHVAAGLLLFGVLRRSFSVERLHGRFGASASWLAFAVALVWLVHPLQTESVTYLVQRVESLMGLFYLATLYCAIRAGEGPRRRAWAAAAIASCALGMGTKEVMVTAPLMVLLWDRSFAGEANRRARWPLYLGLAATWIILGVLVYQERRAPSVELGGEMPWRYLVTQAGVVAHYLRLAAWPSPLVFLYTWPIAGSLRDVAGQAAVPAALLALTAFAIARRHALGFPGAWFFLILAPTSSVLPIVTEVAAEHRMYLPLAAVVTLVAVGLHHAGAMLIAGSAAGSPRRRQMAAVGALLVAIPALALGSATRARNRDYWSEAGLWRDTVEKQPANQRARVAYGVALSGAGRLMEAQAQLEAAVALQPTDPVAQGRLGAVLAAQGRLDEAVPHMEQAVRLRPEDLDAQRALGEAYAARREDSRAVPHLERALSGRGEDPALLSRLAAILADSRDPSVRDGARALVLADRAARLTSRRDAFVLDILAVAQAGVGRFEEAAATVAEALPLARARGNPQLVAELEYRAAAYQAGRGARGERPAPR